MLYISKNDADKSTNCIHYVILIIIENRTANTL